MISKATSRQHVFSLSLDEETSQSREDHITSKFAWAILQKKTGTKKYNCHTTCDGNLILLQPRRIRVRWAAILFGFPAALLQSHSPIAYYKETLSTNQPQVIHSFIFSGTTVPDLDLWTDLSGWRAIHPLTSTTAAKKCRNHQPSLPSIKSNASSTVIYF